jgi:uncharacterized membrane protein YhaH (DUF805 family)
MDLKTLLFSFEGRISRLQFWLSTLGVSVVFYIALFIVATVIGASAQQFAAGGPPPAFYAVAFILYVPFLWAHLAINSKRCHDRDRSAWFILVSLIPLVGIWYLIEIGFLDGTQGPNRFGPSPKGIGGTQVSSVFS